MLACAMVGGCAAPIPPYLTEPFAQSHIGAVASLRYQDENGRLIGEREFATRMTSQGFTITKARDDGLPDVTVRLRGRDEHPFSRLKIGETMPPFQLQGLDGSVVDNKSLQGRYTLVNFYAAEFDLSAKETPLLNALAARRQDVNLLAVTADDAATTRAFVARNALAWPVVTDASKLIHDIGEHAYPALALFDPEGRLVEVKVGIGLLAYPDRFDAWLDQKLTGVAPPVRTPAVVDFRSCPKPVYPRDELRAKHTGTVTLRFLISAEGGVRKVDVATSSGFPGLDQAALTMLGQCRFTPATLAGVPVETWQPVLYRWTID
jgi:TonB family protein